MGDPVESYTIHMLLARRLKIISTSNLKLIISFFVLLILLLSSIKLLSIVASMQHAHLTLRTVLRLSNRPSAVPAGVPWMRNQRLGVCLLWPWPALAWVHRILCSWSCTLCAPWVGSWWWDRFGVVTHSGQGQDFFATTGIGGASSLSITSSITAGAGDVGILAGGHDLCMAGVLLARGFHMKCIFFLETHLSIACYVVLQILQHT